MSINYTTRLLILAQVFVASTVATSAEMVSNTKDGITISADASVETDGRTRISCSLMNHSPYTLASVHTGSLCSSFQFQLLDSNGNRVPQLEKWSMLHRQDEWNDPDAEHRSYNRIIITPSDKTEFHFYLEDGYGERASLGKILEVRWKNIYSGTSTDIDVGERHGADGKIIPPHREANHFPGLWMVSVNLPLPKKADGETISPGTEKSPAPHTADEHSGSTNDQKSDLIHPNGNVDYSFRRRSWLWAFLLVPMLFVAWIFLRLKQNR